MALPFVFLTLGTTPLVIATCLMFLFMYFYDYGYQKLDMVTSQYCN